MNIKTMLNNQLIEIQCMRIINLCIAVFFLYSSSFAGLLVAINTERSVSNKKVKLDTKNDNLTFNKKNKITNKEKNDYVTLEDNTQHAIQRTKGYGHQPVGLNEYVFKNTTIKTPVNVFGKLLIQQSILDANLGVIGCTTLINTKINKPFNITGSLKTDYSIINTTLGLIGTMEAKYSIFNKDIIANNGKLTLYHSSANDIKVNVGDVFVSGRNKNEPNVILDNHTIVKDIIFTSGEGIVIVKNHSKITGKVTSGKIIYQQP